MSCKPHASMTLTEKVREAYHAVGEKQYADYIAGVRG